jgi:hypothetical protein
VISQEKFKKQMKLFEENYEILFSNIEKPTQKIEIGNKQHKICRFCDKNESQTTFKTIAHTIPECLGNKTLICLDECDECNKFFSENIENHLDKVTLPYRTINMIKGRRKIPTYKTQDKKARIDIEDPVSKFMKIIAREDSDFVKLDEKNKTITIEYDLQSYIPCAAYKTLVKMALSVMLGNELNNFNVVKRWILEKDHSKSLLKPLNVLMTFIPGIKPLSHTLIFLFKRYSKNEKYPQCMFVLAFGNIIYQIVIPTDEEIKQKQSTKTILKFLSPFELGWQLGEPTHKILDWTQHTILKAHKQYIEFSYDEIKKLDPKGIKL